MNQLQWWAIKTFGIPILQCSLTWIGGKVSFLNKPNQKVVDLLDKTKSLDIKSLEEMKNTVRNE